MEPEVHGNCLVDSRPQRCRVVQIVVFPHLRVKPVHYMSPSESLSLSSGDVVIIEASGSVYLKSFGARENDGKSMSQWPWSCDVYQEKILKRKCKFLRLYKQFTTFHWTLVVHSKSPLICQEPPLPNSALQTHYAWNAVDDTGGDEMTAHHHTVAAVDTKAKKF